MLTYLEVFTSQGGLLTLTLSDPSNGYKVQGIDGLDPVKATLVSSSFANMDGGQYHSSRREPRNLKFEIGFKPDYVNMSVQDLRRNLYLYFMPKSQNLFRFHTSDGLYYDIYGRIESFETALFTKDPAVSISAMCYDPDFIDPNPVIVNDLTVSDMTWTVHEYDGSVETGATFTLTVNRDLPEFTIYHIPPDGSIRSMDFNVPLIAGDTLKIVTVPGAKEVTLTRAGSDSSVLYGMAPTSNWLSLEPGSNQIRVYATGAGIPYSLEYLNRYGGL